MRPRQIERDSALKSCLDPTKCASGLQTKEAMPYQSRGFWCCDYCKLTLDSYDDAKQHEAEECQKNPSKSQQSQQQQQQQPHGYRQPPFYQQQQIPSANNPAYFPSGPMSPLATANANAPIKQEGGIYEPTSTAAPLMGLNETSPMNADDSLACQSIEVFEVSLAEASDTELRSQFPTMSAGHIGIRCRHCSGNPETLTKEATIFPSSLEIMADGVRTLLEQHLGHCTLAPVSAREMHQQAIEKRRVNDQERGSSWQADERSRMAMRDWCHRFCQRQGIVDKGPNNAGLVFMQQTGPPVYSSQDPAVQGRAGTPLSRRRERPTPSMPGDYRGGAGGYEAYGQNTEGYYPAPSDNMPPLGGHPAGTEGSQGMPVSQQQQPQESPSHRGYQQQQPGAPMDAHDNFPFFQEPNGCWSCKYCNHVPPPYRQPQSMWGAPNHMPPPPQYMDQHLSMCQAYHQSMSSQQMFPGGASQGQFPFMAQSFAGGTAQGDWESSGPGSQSRQGYAHGHLETPSGAQGQLSSSHSPYLQTPHQLTSSAGTPSRDMVAQSRPAGISVRRPESSYAAVQHAIDFLTAADRDAVFAPGAHNNEGPLVLDEDKLLLTDYFFHLMKQLRLCRFSEADRKTRGGKREKILIGFGGLQCIHCSEANNSRKFFWSNVDRLANSFAEIPGHVLKCRHCPQQAKDALFQLKQLHPEQMARLPRGSQKVFFRRMWRRLHDKDPGAARPEQSSPPQAASSGGTRDVTSDEKFPALQTKVSGNDSSPSGGTIGSDESVLLMQRSTREAAKALADAASMSFPPSPTSRVLLAIPEDKEWLSDTDCFTRRQIEVFCATIDDVNAARNDRKFPVQETQVGIRCIHCALSKQGFGARGSAVAYPFSVSGIYESVREFQRLHLDSCENLPVELKAKLSGLKGSTSLSSVLRKYYVLAAKALGLQDTRDGIRAGAGSVAIGSQAAFAFSESSSTISEEMRRSTMSSFADGTTTPMDNRKRKSDGPESAGSKKRTHS